MRSVKTFVLRSVVPALLVLGLVLPTTGCNQTPAQVVQQVVNALQDIQIYAQEASQLAVLYQQLDPALSQQVSEYVNLAQQNLGTLVGIGNAYLKAPSGDLYQQLLNGVAAFTQSINQATLTAAKISNPQTQQKVLTIIALAATAANIALGLLEHYASKKQLKAIPAPAQVQASFQEVKPFLNREYARVELDQMGYPGDEVLVRMGL